VEQAAMGAAVELIAERGYAGTTIDGIAQRSGLAKTTLYRRWDSKGELAVAALAARLGEPPVAEVPGRAGLEATIGWLATQVSDPSVRLLLVGLTGEAARDPGVRAGLRERIRDPFTRRLAQRWGLPRPTVDLVFDVVVGTLLHRVVMTGRVEAADIATVTGLATRLLFEE
jgi:AcrR family transcriptional regulator